MSQISLLQRLKERKLVQWALAYLAGAWVLFEVSDAVGGRLGWPDTLYHALLVLLGIGFFITLVLAWYHGERGRQRVSGPELLMVAALLVVAGGVLSILGVESETLSPSGFAAPHLDIDRPSIAVLPFENLSSEEENAYFASGLHEGVLTLLNGVAGIRVISRTSVLQYEANRPNVRVIAGELGVNHVAEGSVQRIGNRLRVTVQLIDPSTDDHLWANQYNRTLDDAFAVQSEIAQAIVGSLAAVLSPEEQGAISETPTENPEAYRFYLQGQAYFGRPGFSKEDLEAAENLFERAVALDPDFGLALAQLSRVHARMYILGQDRSQSRFAAQRTAAEEARRVQPDLPYTHVAVGDVYYASGDYRSALGEYQTALAGLPNDSEVHKWIGYAHRRLGNWSDVFAAFETATRLNPRDADLYQDLGGNTFKIIHRYAEAVAAYDRALTLAPDYGSAAWGKGLTYLTWQGQLDTLRASLEHMSAPPTRDLLQLQLWERDADGVFAVLGEGEDSLLISRGRIETRSLYSAWAHRLRGDQRAARAAFDSARVLLEEYEVENPDDPGVHGGLGYAYAGLEQSADAVHSVERLLEPYIDRMTWPQWAEEGAKIMAQAGLVSQAVEYLEPLLDGPSNTSVKKVRMEWHYDPIRDNPRFRALLERFGEGVQR
jgi:TolB-like protein/tetratricopeptide (TPR) repeat protein